MDAASGRPTSWPPSAFPPREEMLNLSPSVTDCDRGTDRLAAARHSRAALFRPAPPSGNRPEAPTSDDRRKASIRQMIVELLTGTAVLHLNDEVAPDAWIAIRPWHWIIR